MSKRRRDDLLLDALQHALQRHPHVLLLPPTGAVALPDLQEFWKESKIEIIAVVEAIDPFISGIFQALQSYKVPEVTFGAQFEQGGGKRVG